MISFLLFVFFLTVASVWLAKVIDKRFCRMSYVLKGFFVTFALVLFFIGGIAGTLFFLFDGLENVMVSYSLSVNSRLLGMWWIVPAAFGVIIPWYLQAESIYIFFRKSAGTVAAAALAVMIIGEIAKNVGSTNIVMIVNAFSETLSRGDYEKETVLAIRILFDIFRVFGAVFCSGFITAFCFSAARQIYARKR